MTQIISKMLFINRAFAQCAGSGCPTKSIGQILNDLVSFSVGLGLTIASLAIIYAAYLILTSGGDTEQFEQGKRTITYAVIGVLLFLLSSAIVYTIKLLLGYK